MKNEAELKLDLIRMIDKVNGNILNEIHEFIKLKSTKQNNKEKLSLMEAAYRSMAQDSKRELAANEWIENTTDFNEI